MGLFTKIFSLFKKTEPSPIETFGEGNVFVTTPSRSLSSISNYYCKIWSDFPAYIAHDRFRAWINIVGKSCNIYVYASSPREDKKFYVNHMGIIVENRTTYISNWQGTVKINQRVFDFELPYLPVGNWKLVVEMRNTEDELITSNFRYFSYCGGEEECLSICRNEINEMRVNLSKWLVDPDLPQDNIGTDTITYAELMILIKDELGYDEHPFGIYLSDGIFKVPNEEYLEYILALNAVSENTYVNTKYDCDNFAAETLGLFNQVKIAEFAIGLIWDNAHAYNIAIVNDREGNRKIKFIEPQNDRIYDFKERLDSGYRVRLVVI